MLRVGVYKGRGCSLALNNTTVLEISDHNVSPQLVLVRFVVTKSQCAHSFKVTGVSGFPGSHVLDRLLKEGYHVRGTVRSAKVAAHKEVYPSYGSRVEIVAVDDLIDGDFTSALQD